MGSGTPASSGVPRPRTDGPRNAPYTGGPGDAEIERGLREKAFTDPRAAEILLRWLQRPRQDNPPGMDLDALSEAQLERLHPGLVRLALLDETVLAALVEQVLAGDEPVPS